MVHGVQAISIAPLTAFLNTEGIGGNIEVETAETTEKTCLEALKTDIETFNKVEIKGIRWLKKPTEHQNIGSLVLAVPNKVVKKHCILKGLLVANQPVKVVPYRETALKTLCGRC